MHGWIEPASDYDRFCTHLASWGFVVISNDTETALLFVKMQRQAKDTRALMQWVEDESQDTASWLYGMTDNLPWSSCGHSMGGGVAALFAGTFPSRVRQLITVEAVGPWPQPQGRGGGRRPCRGPAASHTAAHALRLFFFASRRSGI